MREKDGVSVDDDVEEISSATRFMPKGHSLLLKLTRCTANCLVGSSTSIRIFRIRSSGKSERVNWWAEAEAEAAAFTAIDSLESGLDGTTRVAVASGVGGVSGSSHSAALSASEREDFSGGVDSSIVAGFEGADTEKNRSFFLFFFFHRSRPGRAKK